MSARREYVAFEAGRAAAEHDARVAAFAAIRRGAAVARQCDLVAASWRTQQGSAAERLAKIADGLAHSSRRAIRASMNEQVES